MTMPRRGKKDCDDKLLLALAAGMTVPGAAAQAGCSERTVRRRLADPDFQARVRRVRADMLDRAAGALSAASVKAAAALAKLLDSDKEPVVLGAARVLLDSVLKVREQTELERRLAALEQAEQARKGEGEWR
jgi:hypothetical protein